MASLSMYYLNLGDSKHSHSEHFPKSQKNPWHLPYTLLKSIEILWKEPSKETLQLSQSYSSAR